jgi:type II restriction enzyme
MNLSLYQEEVFLKYKSPSQRIRVMSEDWFQNQIYCPACKSDKIDCLPNNTPVGDFVCPECSEIYQLKSLSSAFGKRVNDGAYQSMMGAIHNNKIPNFFFLHYSPADFSVMNLMLVPRFFFSESIIEVRKPLSSSARRAGWTGCNILFRNLAEDGKIKVIEKGHELHREEVRKSWQRISFLKETKTQTKGWINDVMWCVNKLGKKEFSLKEIYSFGGHLKELHPENNNVQPKIRQQLQFLRDKNYLQFLGNGNYKVVNK